MAHSRRGAGPGRLECQGGVGDRRWPRELGLRNLPASGGEAVPHICLQNMRSAAACLQTTKPGGRGNLAKALERNEKRASGLTACTKAKRAAGLIAAEVSGLANEWCSLGVSWPLFVTFCSPAASIRVSEPAETASKEVRASDLADRTRAKRAA